MNVTIRLDDSHCVSTDSRCVSLIASPRASGVIVQSYLKYACQGLGCSYQPKFRRSLQARGANVFQKLLICHYGLRCPMLNGGISRLRFYHPLLICYSGNLVHNHEEIPMRCRSVSDRLRKWKTARTMVNTKSPIKHFPTVFDNHVVA